MRMRGPRIKICLVSFMLILIGIAIVNPAFAKVAMNFDEVDISIFLKTMSEVTGKSFILSDKVKGNISFVSSKDVPDDKVYDVVLAILMASGFSAVPGENNIVHIYPSQEALKMSGRIFYGSDFHEEKVEGIITQIIPLKFADSNTVVNVVRPVFSSDLLITAYRRTNAVVANGNVHTINLLLSMIQFLDTEIAQEQSDIHIYHLENADATTMSQTLQSMSSGIPTRKDQQQQQQAPEAGYFRERFRVVANVETNSLIIISDPQDWEKIERIIVELDKKRQQVLVEAMIVEIDLQDDQDLGFDMRALIDTGMDAEGLVSFNSGIAQEAIQTGGIQGMTIGLLKGDFDMYAILAANRENDNIKILSTPEIVTIENHEATINISEQIPFITGSRVDENNNVIETIEYRDVGILLKLTPHINEKGYITMDINQTIQKIVEETRELANPSVFNREITSKVTVMDSRTIVIGGLIRDDTQFIEQKVPFLGDIPLLGLFFRRKKKQRLRTNLLVFITPTIVTDDEIIAQVTEERKAGQQELEQDWVRKGFKGKIEMPGDESSETEAAK
jgi:general secretion pathway protein D